jgi:NADP-dependent 3-hydroxy acid dehydrogenase YdfG
VSAPLAGRTALVTGASRGIGAAIAASLGAAGARVALLSRTHAALEASASQIGNESFAVKCDVTDKRSLEAALDNVQATLERAPDIVVCNAGLFAIKAVDQTSVAEFDAFVATNLTGSFAVMHEFLGEMKQRASGHFITIGSIADRHIFAGNAAYSATKFGVRALHEVLREETRGTGVRATLISPSSTATDIWKDVRYLGTDILPDTAMMLDADSVAAAVLFAVTQPASVNIDELRLSLA